jgi:hypothetical protein
MWGRHPLGRLPKRLAMLSLVGFVSVSEGRVKMGAALAINPEGFLI